MDSVFAAFLGQIYDIAAPFCLSPRDPAPKQQPCRLSWAMAGCAHAFPPIGSLHDCLYMCIMKAKSKSTRLHERVVSVSRSVPLEHSITETARTQ